MSPLLSPISALVATLVAAGLLVLVAVARRRARRVVVPALDVWLEHRGQRLPPRWRRMLLLALQILAIAAMMAAVVDPLTLPGRAGGERACYHIVDGSASMGATTRLGAAADIVRSEPCGLVWAGSPPRVLAEPGSDPDHRARLLARQAPEGSDSLLQATRLVESLGSEPRVLTDAPGLTPKGGQRRVVGKGTGDVGIEALTVSRGPGLPARYAASVTARSHGGEPVDVVVAFRTDQGVLGTRTVSLTPEAPTTVWLGVPADATGRLEAEFDDHDDGFDANDRASVVLPELTPPAVAVVGRRDEALTTALSVLPGHRASEQPDVTFFDGVWPEVPPSGPAVVWYPPPSDGVRATVSTPRFSRWDHDHPLFSGVAVGGLDIRRTRILKARPDDTLLATTAQGPAILQRRTGAPMVVLGPDLTASEIRDTVSFPQLVYNAVVWARSQRYPPLVVESDDIVPTDEHATRWEPADSQADTKPRGAWPGPAVGLLLAGLFLLFEIGLYEP